MRVFIAALAIFAMSIVGLTTSSAQDDTKPGDADVGATAVPLGADNDADPIVSSAPTVRTSSTQASATTGSINARIPADVTMTLGPADPLLIPVSVLGLVTDVEVDLRLDHTWVGDLTVMLESPDGTIQTIVDRIGRPPGGPGLGYNGDDFGSGADDCSGTPLVLSDAATNPIEAANVSPVVGNFTPENPLAAFDGGPIGGDWTVYVEDLFGGDFGAIYCATLRFSFDSAPAAPVNPVAVAFDTEVTVSWGAPDPGAFPISGYMVTASPGGATCSTAGALSCVVPGLTNNTPYTFAVTAMNAAGTSPEAMVGPVTPVPFQSRIFVANRIASGPADYNFLFGSVFSRIIAGDWDGNGTDGFGSRTGNVYTLVDERGNPFKTVGYGKPTDTTLVGDWNASGTDTLAARRGNIYYLKNTIAPGNADIVLGYGKAGDEVFVGDWNGNGQDTFAVRRGNVFYVRNSTSTGIADIVFGYGKAGDEVLVGDWDQDGIDTFAVRRGNMIFIRNDFRPGPATTVIAYGKASDELLVGDWNNNGVDTFSVRRLEPK